jgi:hypothetical protein
LFGNLTFAVLLYQDLSPTIEYRSKKSTVLLREMSVVDMTSSGRFFTEEEEIFNIYVTRSSDIMFLLTPKEVLTFANLCAVENDIRILPSRDEKAMDRADWLSNFSKDQKLLQ